mgnify:CR=1 FL=1
MKHHDVRNRLIERTITVIAENGLDKTTTKSIVKGTDINEVYIYRHFATKEDLLVAAFEMLDTELVGRMMQQAKVMHIKHLAYELRCRIFFEAVWKYLLGSKEECLAFIRYYYSPYFIKYSAETHRQRYQPLLDRISPVFKEEANIWMILSHILNVMLNFAVKVHIGHMPDSDDCAEHVFRVIYASVKQYFREEDGPGEHQPLRMCAESI